MCSVKIEAHISFTYSKDKKKGTGNGTFFYLSQAYFFPNLIEDCAAASLAMGTLNGEQLT